MYYPDIKKKIILKVMLLTMNEPHRIKTLVTKYIRIILLLENFAVEYSFFMSISKCSVNYYFQGK